MPRSARRSEPEQQIIPALGLVTLRPLLTSAHYAEADPEESHQQREAY
jgi:hypothetical protein